MSKKPKDGTVNHRVGQVKIFETQYGFTELRAVTCPDYGSIHDRELVESVRRIAGNGTGGTRWDVPGVKTTPSKAVPPQGRSSRARVSFVNSLAERFRSAIFAS